jgi:hypothetical protein
MRTVAALFVTLLMSLVVSSLLSAEPISAEPSKPLGGNFKADKIAGIVVDEQGAPLDGADVVYSWRVNRENKTAGAKTDKRGRFSLSAAEGGAWPTGEIWAVARDSMNPFCTGRIAH